MSDLAAAGVRLSGTATVRDSDGNIKPDEGDKEGTHA